MDLSIIIPTYNRRLLTMRAVKSVLKQKATHLKFEIIVMDDGSSDDTLYDVRGHYRREIEQGLLRVQTREHIGDPAATRNDAVKFAQGKYLAFLDSDDYWKPERLLEIESIILKSDFSLNPSCSTAGVEDWLSQYLKTNWGNSSSVVIKKSLFEMLGGFPVGYFGKPKSIDSLGFEDYEFWLKALCHLAQKQQLDRFYPFASSQVVIKTRRVSLGNSMTLREQMLRELATLTRVGAQLPKKYYPQLLRRLAGAAKASVFGGWPFRHQRSDGPVSPNIAGGVLAQYGSKSQAL